MCLFKTVPAWHRGSYRNPVPQGPWWAERPFGDKGWSVARKTVAGTLNTATHLDRPLSRVSRPGGPRRDWPFLRNSRGEGPCVCLWVSGLVFLRPSFRVRVSGGFRTSIFTVLIYRVCVCFFQFFVNVLLLFCVVNVLDTLS